MSNVLNDVTSKQNENNGKDVVVTPQNGCGLFAGASFHNCTFNMGTTVYRACPPFPPAKTFRLLSEQDEENLSRVCEN